MITNRDKEILKFIESYGSITINQCAKMFYKGNNTYYLARKRLRVLYKNGILKRFRKDMNSECYYYIEKKPSVHNSKILDIVAELNSLGCNILNFHKGELKVGNYKIDGLLEVEYNDYFYSFIIEVDYTHLTGTKKLDNIYFSGIFQEKYRDLAEDFFPSILIIRPSQSKLVSKLYNIHNLDFNLTDIKSILL